MVNHRFRYNSSCTLDVCPCCAGDGPPIPMLVFDDFSPITKPFKTRIHSFQGYGIISIHLFQHCMTFACRFTEFVQEIRIDTLLHDVPQNHRTDNSR
ncbi:hypothetical protein AVEN_150082-1 [Araneus ventricosus]|uniref:Uncharacterized protein n=1 Tax=Araneus ventricosus TaxID=182803 RepID=A0A4Y2DE27_ARAVE|nr:hypothetical protein AVEN_150082-1 [Araneus ventricosus]